MQLEWTAALAAGNPAVDAPHRELVSRAARLLGALRSGDRSEVGPTIAFLSAYASSHFAAEERLMREAGYPGIEAHAREHEAFVAGLGRLAARFDEKGATLLVAMELHNWLSGWLHRHLQGADRALAEFLRSRS